MPGIDIFRDIDPSEVQKKWPAFRQTLLRGEEDGCALRLPETIPIVSPASPSPSLISCATAVMATLKSLAHENPAINIGPELLWQL